MTAITPQDSRTEATRLLCAGTYLDIEFRRRVVEELVEHEERPIAPSLGVDVVPVLAHALRARRQDALTALMLLVLWGAFIGIEVGTADGPPLPIWSGIYALVSFFQWSAAASAGRGSSVYVVDKRTLREAMKGNVRKLVPAVPAVLAIAYWAYALYSLATGSDNWIGIVFPLLLVLPVWAHRRRVADVMCNELSREAFLLAPRAEPTTAYHQRIARAIDREQYAGMAIYDAGRPFIGMGKPYEPWSFALELRRRGDTEAPDGGAAPFTGRTVVDLVRPRLEALRQGAAATSRDRLKDLEIEEFVYLPVGPPRPRLDYADATVTQHVAEAVDEGGEARRYFLRVRVGAWDEQVVVSVLVRVHTQGGMLVLEVVPHILTPIRTEFRSVDVIAARGQDDPLRDGLRALLSGPAAGFAAAVSTVRAGISGFRTWLAEPQRALPDGPAQSVRELGGAETVSLFQEMDISRYVKTVQDRIASGVRDALRSQGYETDQFEQQIVQISEGGVFIGSMSGGAVAAGAGAKAKNMTKDGGS
ncbi:hypothetical protein M1P56_30225 [Streptomyces sp. HU2014]|uniref:Uncharacterized protein n=1 Tax=Streptomyces albireticuli TaxID=1940 RepID=A0A1Z2L243_9ACTN|nr:MULTISPECIES: hypothetical protein [Streptomyces]ARZ68336.1 hypothetical protein SMD11_2687 [Streptomyces albireticuli]UQI48292.1 hypothetical protein M1P56_30225 [Streptomyces sp. HU2014]